MALTLVTHHPLCSGEAGAGKGEQSEDRIGGAGTDLCAKALWSGREGRGERPCQRGETECPNNLPGSAQSIAQ